MKAQGHCELRAKLCGKARVLDIPKNSPAVGRPSSVTSNSNLRAIFNPLLIWYEPFISGSLIKPFQPTVVRGLYISISLRLQQIPRPHAGQGGFPPYTSKGASYGFRQRDVLFKVHTHDNHQVLLCLFSVRVQFLGVGDGLLGVVNRAGPGH